MDSAAFVHERHALAAAEPAPSLACLDSDGAVRSMVGVPTRPGYCYTSVVARLANEAARRRPGPARETDMAKGQLRSNKETKKPKKAKTPAAAPVSPFAANAGASAAAAERNKKK